jgi:hypothetical protein
MTQASNVVSFPGKQAVEPPAHDWTPQEIRRLLAPSLMALPFISNTDECGVQWNDVPTGDYRADHERGEHFAAMAIEAIAHDQCSPRWVELILHAIVTDAVKRKTKGGGRGPGSRIRTRALTTTVEGFLCGLANHITDSLKTPAA